MSSPIKEMALKHNKSFDEVWQTDMNWYLKPLAKERTKKFLENLTKTTRIVLLDFNK